MHHRQDSMGDDVRDGHKLRNPRQDRLLPQTYRSVPRMNLDNIFGCVFSVGGLRQKIWTAAIEFVQSQGQSAFRLDAPEHTSSAGAGEKAEEIRRPDPRSSGFGPSIELFIGFRSCNSSTRRSCPLRQLSFWLPDSHCAPEDSPAVHEGVPGDPFHAVDIGISNIEGVGLGIEASEQHDMVVCLVAAPPVDELR